MNMYIDPEDGELVFDDGEDCPNATFFLDFLSNKIADALGEGFGKLEHLGLLPPYIDVQMYIDETLRVAQETLLDLLSEDMPSSEPDIEF